LPKLFYWIFAGEKKEKKGRKRTSDVQIGPFSYPPNREKGGKRGERRAKVLPRGILPSQRKEEGEEREI